VIPSRKLPISVPAPVTRLILYNWVVPMGSVNKASPEPDGVSTPGGMSKPLLTENPTPTGPTAV
jgi:hypothetical protein